MTAILTLYLGTSTGWALRTTDGRVVSGTESFRPGRFEGGGMRFLRFQGWLDELAGASRLPASNYFEEVWRHAGVVAAHVYWGLMATLTAWCEQRDVPYAGVPVGTIKKHATGKGYADEAAMIASAQVRGFNPANDDEADALALLQWAIAQPVSTPPKCRACTAVSMRRFPRGVSIGLQHGMQVGDHCASGSRKPV